MTEASCIESVLALRIIVQVLSGIVGIMIGSAIVLWWTR